MTTEDVWDDCLEEDIRAVVSKANREALTVYFDEATSAIVKGDKGKEYEAAVKLQTVLKINRRLLGRILQAVKEKECQG